MAPKPKLKPDPHFKAGSPVEISSDDPGFRGSWYTGTIIRRASSKNPSKFLVQYDTMFADEAGTKPLKEIVDSVHLRPLPPRERERSFKFSEEVDAYHNDGWWEGVITEELENGKFAVFFRPTREQITFGKEDLRLHREWVNGDWKPPFEEQNIPVSTEKNSDEAVTVEKFSKGELVEVSSDEEGYRGAWFAATIIEPVGKDKYLVEYKNLRTEDDTAFLREEIDTLHIRHCPPETIAVDRFKKFDEVDALYNDAWWVGVISKVLVDSRYTVYFKSTNEEMEFQHSELRQHHDWIDGKWVTASQALKM